MNSEPKSLVCPRRGASEYEGHFSRAAHAALFFCKDFYVRASSQTRSRKHLIINGFVLWGSPKADHKNSMTFLKKLLVGAAAASMAFMPVLVRAEDTTHVLPPALGLKGELRAEWEAKKKAMAEEKAERREVKDHIGLGIKVKTIVNATTTIEKKRVVRAAAQVWHEYRATVRNAEEVYKKSEHAARGVFTQALRVAVKTKDGTMAITALEAYFKSDAEADAKLDATRAQARGELMADIKALFS